MLTCKEQKNPVNFFGRKITISEQALNAMYDYCTTPVTEDTIGMYLFANYIGEGKPDFDENEIVASLTDKQIANIIEAEIKKEIIGAAGEEYWSQYE